MIGRMQDKKIYHVYHAYPIHHVSSSLQNRRIFTPQRQEPQRNKNDIRME